MSWLIAETGSLAGRRIEVTSEIVAGRSGADIDIDDPQVSRRHVAIRPVQDAIEVEDLGSTNGTWVNDQRISGRRQLVNGDRLRIGETVLRVATEERAPAAIASPPDRGAAPLIASPAQAPAFGTAPVRRAAATRSYLATTLAVIVIVADAIALILYFAFR